MTELREWLLADGVPDDHLDAYERCAERLWDTAGDGRLMPKHLDMAVARAEQSGATAQQLVNLQRMGETVLRFERINAPVPESVRPPPTAPGMGPNSNRPPAMASPSPGLCGMCGGTFAVGRGRLHVGTLGGIGTAISVGIGYLFGLLGGLALLAALGSLAMLVGAVGTRLTCDSCGVVPDRDELDAALVSKVWMQRAGFLVATIALAAVAVALVLTWLGMAAQRVGA